jgi:para-aminobenzoate synthetase
MTLRPRILFLDAHDSFSNNITALLATLLDAEVFVLTIDSPLLDPKRHDFKQLWQKELSHYTAVLCGPGPGDPTDSGAVGLMQSIWSLCDGILPVLGICLGFQSLVLYFGGKIRRLRRGLHGMVRKLQYQTTGAPDQTPKFSTRGDIFQGVGGFHVTLYHSLCADIGQDDLPDAEWETQRWIPSPACPDLIPLAWVEEDREESTERILMAVKHSRKPFWGLQYHPESVCTDAEGHAVLKNWFAEARRWNRRHRRSISLNDQVLANQATRSSLLSLSNRLPKSTALSQVSGCWKTHALGWSPSSRLVNLPHNIDPPDIVEILAPMQRESIILDSSNANIPHADTSNDNRGRFSIIAVDVHEALRIEHRAGDDFATLTSPGAAQEHVSLRPYQGIWQLLAEFHEARHINSGQNLQSPFLGGFMGYVSYEQGLHDIGISIPARIHHRPDICMVWVTKSLVIDHKKQVIHIQQLRDKEMSSPSWLDIVVSKLKASQLWQQRVCQEANRTKRRRASTILRCSMALPVMLKGLVTPDKAEYQEQVRMCQSLIRAGHSYELCLTGQTSLTIGTRESTECTVPAKTKLIHETTPWQLYRRLRSRQPAPYASYIRIGAAALISGSPERFLQYDEAGLCVMKPMKGTVRKSAGVQTLAQAEAILHVPKEEAENLMIVDLVRHDLHSICGPGNVTVPQLLKVEEYKSVFQMVTVIQGLLPKTPPGREHERYTGLDVLAASLPPGSMTGAPKKSSCALLKVVERNVERGLYSGVVGYMCASGRGEWSVTIRSLFRWDDDQPNQKQPGSAGEELWHVGAGGAVTVLSSPEGEWEEMLTKLGAPLSIFKDLDQVIDTKHT